MDLYLNLMPDLRNIVTGYFGDVIFSQSLDFSQAQDGVNEVTFATAEQFKKSKATDCIFINYEITSIDHKNHPDIPKTLLNCSGVPKIKTHTLAWMFSNSQFNGDISQWDVSSVTDMEGMFPKSQFNNDISQWDVSSAKDMNCMFQDSQFSGDLSKWNVSPRTNVLCVFCNSKIKKETVQSWDNFSKHYTVKLMFG
jgi:surface protein